MIIELNTTYSIKKKNSEKNRYRIKDAYSNKFAFNNLSENLGLLFSFIQNANYNLNVINLYVLLVFLKHLWLNFILLYYVLMAAMKYPVSLPNIWIQIERMFDLILCFMFTLLNQQTKFYIDLNWKAWSIEELLFLQSLFYNIWNFLCICHLQICQTSWKICYLYFLVRESSTGRRECRISPMYTYIHRTWMSLNRFVHYLHWSISKILHW